MAILTSNAVIEGARTKGATFEGRGERYRTGFGCCVVCDPDRHYARSDVLATRNTRFSHFTMQLCGHFTSLLSFLV